LVSVLAKLLHDVRGQFAKRRLALDQELQQKNLSEKRWTLERTKLALQIYHQANFAAYLNVSSSYRQYIHASTFYITYLLA
jgi:hypothetical protein